MKVEFQGFAGLLCPLFAFLVVNILTKKCNFVLYLFDYYGYEN